MDYRDAHQRALHSPEAFWAEQARAVAWFTPPTTVLQALPDGTHRWFCGATLNTAWLALDHQIAQGRGEQVALVYDSPVTATQGQYTYRQVRAEVVALAGVLRRLGVGKGAAVVIYMPMIPQAAFAMLACAWLGAVHSVVFGGFAAHELALRIDDARPTVVLSASCGLEFERVVPYKPLLDAALQQSRHPPAHVLVWQRAQCVAALHPSRDLDWRAQVEAPGPHRAAEATPVAAEDPLYIMYTSGTTGKPKGIVRDNGGHAVALAFALKYIYGLRPGEVWWGISDVGWVVGHSLIVYGPLMAGCTSVLYEGKPVRTPDAGSYWRVVQQYGVNALFCAPTAMRAIRQQDPHGELLRRYNLGSLRQLFLAGEKLDSATHQWLEQLTGKPVLDHWWQTETGWPVTAPCMGLAGSHARAGSSNQAVPGYAVVALDEQGAPLGAGEEGAIALRLPLPPGCSQTLWNDPARYRAAYLARFPGYYDSGDGGFIDADGFVHIMGRTDDVINVAGHRLSTGEMEGLLGQHPAVAECAVIGVPDPIKGQVPLGLVVLKHGTQVPLAQLQAELVLRVREQLGALACLRQVLVVQRLPKTRSGKILRAVLRKAAVGEAYSVPSTIDDPASLEEVAQVLAAR